MTFQEALQECIDNGFDGYADFLMELCKALDRANIKLETQTTDE